MLWLGWAFLIANLPWLVFIDWLRHRPQNLARGTQHLVLLGQAGMLLLLAAALAAFWLAYR
ncbi:MAG TPA: hypothetical protein VFU47_01020 [Armatimonadota bacterium]|nr:hypothetical protein [Armatimonadota bacterium]